MSGMLVCELPVEKLASFNSNGAFIARRDGSLMFVYNQRTASPNLIGDTRVAFVESFDQGYTWSSPQPFSGVPARQDSVCSCVSLVRLLDRSMAVIYLTNRGTHETHPHMRTSQDEGKTWRDDVSCIRESGYYVLNNDRAVRLTSGRLLLPFSYHDMSTGRMGNDTSSEYVPVMPFSSASCHFIYSDDDGRTWRMSENFVSINSAMSSVGLQEPCVVELAPGVLWGLARTDLGRHYEFFSQNNGLSWSQAEPSRFTGPCSPLSIKRVPADGSLIAVWNPIPGNITQRALTMQSGRQCLVYSRSFDNGARWQPPTIIEDATNGEFTHAAIEFTDNGILVAYNSSISGAGRSLSIRLRMLPL